MSEIVDSPADAGNLARMYGIFPGGLDITLTTLFDAAEPLDNGTAGQIVDKLPQVFPHLQFKPGDIALTGPGPVAPFQVQARMLGNKGSLSVTPDRAVLAFREVRLVRDVEPVSNVLLGVSHLLKERAGRAGSIMEIHFHADIKSGGKRKDYFKSLVTPVGAAPFPEGIVYFRYDRAFPSDIRVSIERSDHHPETEGLFFTWTSRFHGVLTPDLAGAIKVSLTNSLLEMKLHFVEESIML